MKTTIFVWAVLLLIGLVSIVKCYQDDSEEEDEMPLARRAFRLDSFNKRSELVQSARSAKLAQLLGMLEESEEVEEQKRAVAGPKLVCHTECPPGQISYAPNTCNCPVGPTTSPCQTQSSGLCSAAATKYSPPTYSIKFGSGSNIYSTATPGTLGFSTTYTQVMNDKQKIQDGSFAIMSTIPEYYGTWLVGAVDTAESGNTGNNKRYMMVIGVLKKEDLLLKFTVDNMNVGFRYQFSAFAGNVVKSGSNILPVSVRFEARTATSDNTLLASTASGNMPEQSALNFKEYGMSFIAPANSVVFSIIANAQGGTGNDFAIDRISVVACAPVDAICAGK